MKVSDWLELPANLHTQLKIKTKLTKDIHFRWIIDL